MPDHHKAIELVLQCLTNDAYGVIADLDEIGAVGHRVGHGGEKLTSSVIINDQVVADIEECCELAPLHNPANLTGITVCHGLMPQVPQVAVFDTAFHQTMPEKAYIYGNPLPLLHRLQNTQIWFSRNIPQLCIQKAAQLLGRPYEQLKNHCVSSGQWRQYMCC